MTQQTLNFPPYPQSDRYPNFDRDFLDLLSKMAVVNMVGPVGMCLLLHVVRTEDARKFRDAPTFWISSLADRCGRHRNNIGRHIDKCVRSGWLHWQKDRNNEIGVAWVKVPIRFESELKKSRYFGADSTMQQNSAQSEAQTSARTVAQTSAQISAYSLLDTKPKPPPPIPAEWEEVERTMIEIGIGETSKPLRSLQAHHVEPGLALAVLRFAMQTKLWGPAKVRQRLSVLLPDHDPTDKRLWMLPDHGQAHPAVQSDSRRLADLADEAKRAESRKVETQLLIDWERDYGPILDAMDQAELLELCPSDGVRRQLQQRGRKFKLVRDTLLRILATQAG